MDLKEAYSILELSESASPAEAKKKYRELVKLNHPDVNKDPLASDKIKKINEAYECVKNGKGNDREIGGPFQRQQNPFHYQQVVRLENINVYLTIDFKDSILGCKKEIKYSRQSKCTICNGSGEIRLSNGCKKCGGKGQTTSQQRGMIFISTCTECHGKINVNNCNVCNSEGSINADITVNVSVPAGISNGNILRLQGIGNYAGSFMGFSDQHTDVFCHISVTTEPGLSLDGQDVISTISITLLEAMRGCTRTVKTIFGDKEIEIKSKSRNCEEVIIPHLGVAGVGNQKIVLDVQYPNDINKLIDILANEAE